MRIIDSPVSYSEILGMFPNYFGDMVKAVADISRRVIAVDAELHADLERELVSSGSQSQNLWGYNIRHGENDESSFFIEYDSLINIKPWVGNRSRYVEDETVREKIRLLTEELIAK